MPGDPTLRSSGFGQLHTGAASRKACSFRTISSDHVLAPDGFSDDTMTSSQAGVVGVVRAGLDIGNEHVRWRPGFEATFGSVAAGGITQSLVVQF